MSQFNATNYEVPRTSGVCALTGRNLEPGEPYYATLVEIDSNAAAKPADESGESATPDAKSKAKADAKSDAQSLANALGMMRLDVSQEAWEQGSRPERMFSYWKSTVPQPNEKKKLFVDDAVLMNLFRRLEDAREPQRQAFRYVLGLILMRKRLLRFDGAERREAEVDGEAVEQEWWQLTPKVDVNKGPMSKWNEEETIELLDPRLDESQIEQVTQQLGEILEAEL
ncbi:hypothetical protein ACERK3_02600 [Phycisphaerales bacterium AB-hyl4]|uniref:Uncharacterized protein n=1 Tax=Natronomicrosphaera hydrolytica TaxID=3242702 RepID=A0ABV4U2U2_9BACT